MKRLLSLLPLLLAIGCAQMDDSSNLLASPLVPGDDASLNRYVATVGAKVSAIRGLQFKLPVQATWVRRENLPALFDSLNAVFDTGASEGSMTFDQFSYAMGYTKALGSYDSADEAFSRSMILGFYLPGTNRLWVVTDASTDVKELELTIAHELVHVLQDQNFGLDSYDPVGLDAEYAYTMLVEGDARYTEIMYEYNDPSLDRINPQAFRGYAVMAEAIRSDADLGPMPLIATLPALLPYTWGPRVVHAFRAESGWRAVDSLHVHPFRTTRDMLVSSPPYYRNSYQAFDSLKTFPAFSRLGTWAPRGSGRMGQLLLSTLRTTWANQRQDYSMQGLVDDWQGDRFWIWNKDSARYAVGGLVRFYGDGYAATFAAEVEAQGDAAKDGRLFRTQRSGNLVAVAWGNLDPAEMDSLWKDLISETRSATVAGRVGPGPRWPSLPFRPWGPRPPRF